MTYANSLAAFLAAGIAPWHEAVWVIAATMISVLLMGAGIVRFLLHSLRK